MCGVGTVQSGSRQIRDPIKVIVLLFCDVKIRKELLLKATRLS